MSLLLRPAAGVGLTLLAGLLPAPADARASNAGCVPRAGEARPWLDRALTAECRADLLLRALATTDAKLKALAGEFRDQGVVLGRASDGPVGPTRGGEPISLATPLAMAAAFDPDLARSAGQLVGREFRAGGITRMLGPTLDIARTWQFGRTAEAFGEDPVLTTAVATPYVRAIQGEGVAATLKHYALYAQEQGRTGDLPIGQRPAVNVVVSEKAMRELYLPPFRAAVTEAGALGIMCSFPRINGTYACEHPQLLGILKKEWGFRGVVGPDFPDAQRSVVAAVNAGLDQGSFGLPRMAPPVAPGEKAAGGAPAGPPPAMLAAMGLDRIPGGDKTLEQAVRDGSISQARLDDLIRRTLVTAFALDAIPASPVDAAAAGALAERLATDGAVLLRNEGGILPLGEKVRSVAIIGSQAGGNAQLALTGSAFIPPRNPVSAADAIRTAAVGRTVTFEEGDAGRDALPSARAGLIVTADGANGVRADYHANANLDFSGAPVASRVEAAAESTGSAPVPGLPGDNQWSVRWSGRVMPRVDGLHRFTISGAGSARLLIGGRPVARFARVDFGDIQHAAVDLKAGTPVDLVVEYTPREAAPMPVIPMMGTTLGTHFRLGVAEPDDRIARAVAAARAADVAVVFAANRQGEGADRTTLNLPPEQDRLIEAVAAANPHTVVVLSTGGPVAMPWRGRVAAILETWYAGERFGPAVAALLLGRASPGGRLPMTFPAREDQGPGDTAVHYPGVTDASGALDDVRFDEGTLVGYRWFGAHREEAPLYPFGFGLSYGDVRLGGFAAATRADGSVVVTASATNRGGHRAVEVVQAYLTLPAAAGQGIPKLAGFAKASLAPGETRRIEVVVPASRFSYWDQAGARWAEWRGAFDLTAGRSSADTAFSKRLTR